MIPLAIYLAVDMICILLGCRLDCAEAHDPPTPHGKESRPCFTVKTIFCLPAMFQFFLYRRISEKVATSHILLVLLQGRKDRNLYDSKSEQKTALYQQKYSERLKEFVFLAEWAI